MMKRLDLRTALELQGAYHVTSPTYLESILSNGLMPGGTEGRRMVNFFGRPAVHTSNCVTRTRSPLPGQLYMLVIFITPTELTRFGAGVSGTGDMYLTLFPLNFLDRQKVCNDD